MDATPASVCAIVRAPAPVDEIAMSPLPPGAQSLMPVRHSVPLRSVVAPSPFTSCASRGTAARKPMSTGIVADPVPSFCRSRQHVKHPRRGRNAARACRRGLPGGPARAYVRPSLSGCRASTGSASSRSSPISGNTSSSGPEMVSATCRLRFNRKSKTSKRW